MDRCVADAKTCHVEFRIQCLAFSPPTPQPPETQEIADWARCASFYFWVS
ncbi:hypothetical protein CCP3SC5AM1_1270009 [Gammaproteobacteria bacterium]